MATLTKEKSTTKPMNRSVNTKTASSTKVTTKATTGLATATTAAPTHEQIAARAYTIWLSGKGGSSYDHWIQAEKELKAKR